MLTTSAVHAARAAVRAPFTKMVRFGSTTDKGHEQFNAQNPHNIPPPFVQKRTVRTVNIEQFVRQFPVYAYTPYVFAGTGMLFFFMGL